MHKTLLALAFSAIATVPLSAQAPVLGNLTFRGADVSNGVIGNAVVGPYKGELAGYSPLFADDVNAVLWCVDFDHFAPGKGTTDSYWATSVISPFNSTYTVKTDESLYLKAAWLIERYNAGTYGYSATDVQGTIWELFNASTFNPAANSYTDRSGDLAAFNAGDLTREWFVLSDSPDYNGETRLKNNQEFLYSIERTPEGSVVPEPEAFALVILGLLGLGVSRRGRQLFTQG